MLHILSRELWYISLLVNEGGSVEVHLGTYQPATMKHFANIQFFSKQPVYKYFALGT